VTLHILCYPLREMKLNFRRV